MSFNIEDLRKIANGELNEEAIRQMEYESVGEYIDPYDVDEEELMQECAEMAFPLILQAEIMGDECESMTESVEQAYRQLMPYFAGQNLISEAGFVPSNKKLNVVYLNKESLMNRQITQNVLMFARRNNDKAFKKFKLACALKKKNRDEMFKKYQAKATQLAKKQIAAMKAAKPQDVVNKVKKDTSHNTPRNSNYRSVKNSKRSASAVRTYR